MKVSFKKDILMLAKEHYFSPKQIQALIDSPLDGGELYHFYRKILLGELPEYYKNETK